MEREGSGFDKMYEILLTNGKHQPKVEEKDDRVTVTISKRINKNEVVSLINKVNKEYQLSQHELICLGIIAQNTVVTALQFSDILNLPRQNDIKDWLGKLLELGIIKVKGRTKGAEYFVNPEVLKSLRFKGKTNLKRIEDHRLRELIFEDLKTYSPSAISGINQRIGMEIPTRKIKAQMDKLLASGEILAEGDKRWRRYSINKNK